MGKGKNAQKKKISKSKKINKKTLLSTFSIEELLKKAQDEINIFNYKEAQQYCHEALQRDPDNLRALEVSASLCMETGNFDRAKHCFGRAITLAPETGFTKYLSMGQLFEGKESLQCYLKGIELIQKAIKEEKESKASEIKSPQQNGVLNSIKDDSDDDDEENSDKCSKIIDPSNSLERKLSNSYCAVAELFMSDLCDEDEAEAESLSNVQKAIEIDNTNPEAYHYYANFLLIKERVEEAKENIKKSVSLWLPKYEAVDKGEASEGSFDPVEVCPISESARCKTAQILIEVEEHELAADVLRTLIAEDDEVHKKSPTDDESIIHHMEEMLEELKDVEIDLEEDELENIEELEEEIELMDVS
ncbi:putative assembly chaperone of rpl4 [Armadillidium nasatum]|uniref:Putative assembly chaperone of rpl4 n=1 Tax=Armadillidium nasatum TaxID=96803 RepID=A0A5N5SJZ9_9CRUS|nr:putative assembly chaperone of rpl4 [Armadillidium nasatum]